MRKKIHAVLLLIAFAVGALGIAHAKQKYMDNFANRYPDSPLKLNCSVCHTNPPSLNSYGEAFEESDEDFKKIESSDSDGDGFSNVAEINAGTFPGDPASNPSSVNPVDGATLYAQSCATCHGPLATSTKKGKTVSQIQSAINGNIGNMGGLSNLTASQVQAIADVLAQQTPPPPPPPPPPVTDGATLYAQSCVTCHGPLATSTKIGRTASQIQAAINGNIGNMGGLSNLTANQVQAIADVLAQQTPPSPPPPVPPPAATDGVTLYAQSCVTCHGPLATSTKIGRTASQIQAAINGNIGNMGGLSNLTASQVQAIADVLAQQTPPPAPPSSSDTMPPTVTSFTIPSASGSLTISINTFDAADDVGVTGYMITESATPPTPGAAEWSPSPPANHTFTSVGPKNLYAWAKDAAGNVSASLSATITVFNSGPAPDMTIWVGKWFKIAEKNTGYRFSDSGFSKTSGTYPGYLKLWNWDPVNKVFDADRYEQETQTGQWLSTSLSLYFLAGKELDFFSWAQETGDYTSRFITRIQGHAVDSALEKATFKTLGGYYVDAAKGSEASQNGAGGLVITGTLIPEAKVPVPSDVLLH